MLCCEFSFVYPLALAKHPLEHPLHRRQGGDDDAENRIHADGEEIVDQRINPGVAEPVLLRIGAKENRAGNRARHHPQKPRDSRAQRQVLREKRGGAKQRKRHEVVQNELHGMHEVDPLHQLQQRERKRRDIAVARPKIGGIRKDRQHGEQRDGSAQRQREELEVTQHERKRNRQRAVDERLRAAEFARLFRLDCRLRLCALGIGHDHRDEHA